MTTITAAVSRGDGAPFSFEQLELDDPRPDELLVKITSSGVCHTDLAVIHGAVPMAWPAVLGHEGAGVVERVGSAVTDFRPGDRVALSFAWCGHCAECLSGHPAYCANMFPLNFGGIREDGSTTMSDSNGSVVHGSFFGQSSFATYALTDARGAVHIPEGIDPDLVGPLGCGFQTGAGAIINKLRVATGASVIVSGAGAVGLAAVMAARAVGATTIVAVDVLPSRLDVALELGATHVVDGRDPDVVARLQQIVGRGADYAFDTTGLPPVILNSLAALKLGGEIGLVASGPEGSVIPTAALVGKTAHFLIEGDAVPRNFLPSLLELHRLGRFPFDKLITKYPFEDMERAIADTQSGAAVKAVLTMR